MALIKCPECGKEISDKAEICVNCGIKISDIENLLEASQKKEQEIQQHQSDKAKTIVVLVIVFIIAIFAIWLAWYQSTETQRAQKRLHDSIDKINQTQREIDDLERQIEFNNMLIDAYD